MSREVSSERIVKDIRRKTRKRCSAEEKVCIASCPNIQLNPKSLF